MDALYLLELAINGAMAGLMYALVAMGVVLIYKSSSVPNLAQGALTMVGAYMVLAFANGLGAPMWLAIPLAMVAMFFLGAGIERVALRRLAGRPVVMILMMTLGVAIFLGAWAVEDFRWIFSPSRRVDGQVRGSACAGCGSPAASVTSDAIGVGVPPDPGCGLIRPQPTPVDASAAGSTPDTPGSTHR